MDPIKLEVAYNHLAHYIQLETGCANPYDLELTAFNDTAATLTLLTSKAPASPNTHTDLGISMIQHGGTSMHTTHAMDLLLQKLPPNARMAHRLPGLINNLLSVTVLCNAGCKVYFQSTGCEVTLNGEIILRGWRDPKNRLWQVKIIDDGWITDQKIRDEDNSGNTPATPPVGKANGLYECDNTYQLINFYHATLNHPAVSMLVKAIVKGYLKDFAGLTLRQVHQHIKVNNKTEKGHMDQSRQGKGSTKTASPAGIPPPFPPDSKLIDTMEPLPQEPFNAHTHFVFMTIIKISRMLFSNQLGQFPITSNRGNKYVVIFYIYDAIFVKSVPIKS